MMICASPVPLNVIFAEDVVNVNVSTSVPVTEPFTVAPTARSVAAAGGGSLAGGAGFAGGGAGFCPPPAPRNAPTKSITLSTRVAEPAPVQPIGPYDVMPTT